MSCPDTIKNCKEVAPPTVTCVDGEACEFPIYAECVVYSGDNIECTSSVFTGFTHTVIKGAGSPLNQRTLVNALQNINSQLCFAMSKEFIRQQLLLIKKDSELKTHFCTISCGCDC
jgi:hypothetical protein